VPGHFDSVGFPLSDRDEFGQMITDLVGRAEREAAAQGTRLLWSDPSGARVAIFVNDRGSIECAKPSFHGTTTIRIRKSSEIADPNGCGFCALSSVEVLDGDEMVYPLAFELDDVHRGPLTARDARDVSVTAFAEQIESWADEEAFGAGQDPLRPQFAARSLIPSGLFNVGDDPRPPRAEASITGVVRRGERKTNAWTGTAFDWCELETFAATLDVVAAPQPDPFATGQVIQGTFWLVAHRRTGDSEQGRRRRWFRR
jgi:hypothetical protein